MLAVWWWFEGGRPQKKYYRKFKMKTQLTPDDYASMREMLSRRFARYEEEKSSGEGFGRLPDLILLDGGKGQGSGDSAAAGGIGHHRTGVRNGKG